MADKIYKVIYYLFLAFIVAAALLLLSSILPIPRLFGGQAGGMKVFVVQSGSMQPAIKTGSIVAVKPAVSYKIGDIITFGPYSKTKAPTTHRITEMRAQTGQPVYITKGDANNAADTREVLSKDVLGKVYLTVPFVGYVLAAARKPIGFAVLIIIPAAIIVFDEVKKIISEAKKMRERKKGNSEQGTEKKE